MVIKGLVDGDDRLAYMAFNEHSYVARKINMYYSTLYYLGTNPKFGNYIKENDTLVVAGKLSKRDLIEKEATIYSGITITKDKEYINADNVKEDTMYLKNIDVKTGECFSRLYVDGDITDIKTDLYGYKNDNSLVLVTPCIDKNDFNVFDLKENLNKVLSLLCFNDLQDTFDVCEVLECPKNEVIPFEHLEMLINFSDVDTVHVPFKIDDAKILKFYSFVYSEHFNSWYDLNSNVDLLAFETFSYYFSKSRLAPLLNKLISQRKVDSLSDRGIARIYLKDGAFGFVESGNRW